MKSIKPIILSASLLSSAASYALQIHTASEDTQVTAVISKDETSRITLINDRIKQFFVAQGRIVIEKDETKGDLYVTPSNVFKTKDINLFITSESGKTYLLVLTPEDKPSATVAIKATSHNNAIAKDWEQSNAYETTLIELVKTISKGSVPKGYHFQSINKHSKQIIKGLKLKTLSKYEGGHFTGFIYEIRNKTQSALELNFADFKALMPLALALENHKLYPGMSTKVFVITGGV